MAINENIKSNLNAACELTVRLNELVVLGNDETKEGDALREALHGVWIELPKQQRDLIQYLSADLDLLSGTETVVISKVAVPRKSSRKPGAVQPPNLRHRVNKAIELGHWKGVLDLIRLDPIIWTAAQRAFLRAEAYRRIGLPAAAVAFYRFALTLEPKEWAYRTGIIQSLMAGSDIRELEAEIANVTRDPEAPAGALIISAAALCRQFAATRGEERRAYAERVVDLTLLGLGKPLDIATREPRLRYRARFMAAIALAELGKLRDAVAQASEGIRECPEIPQLYIFRGVLNFQLGEQYVEDFAASVKFGTTDPVPYGIMASDSFRRRNFRECLELSKTGLSLDPRPEFKAMFLMFQAISQFELGGSSAGALRLFEASRELDPENKTIQRNFDIMKARATQERRQRFTDYLYTPDVVTSTLNKNREELMSGLPIEDFTESGRLAAMMA
ncbi:MAG TPA: hypothetical protein VFE47_17045 [Tepidisphaeraceae bacterium]|jgi:tetratricopeptide (TPR) repeat protein|nr:hypothetical protein [Tepidisphaeraceae bacterium]